MPLASFRSTCAHLSASQNGRAEEGEEREDDVPCRAPLGARASSLPVPGDVTVGLVFTCGTEEGTEHTERRAKVEGAHALQGLPLPLPNNSTT